MKFFLMRHGEAELFADSDKQRQLTVRGRAALDIKINQIAKQLSEVDIILHSPYVRAKETASIVGRLIECHQFVELDEWIPEGKPESALASLENFTEQTPLVVTHMPLISYVEALCCHGVVDYPASFSCGEIVEIQADWPVSGLGVAVSRY